MTMPPSLLADLIEAWKGAGRPAQPGIPWPRDTWAKAFPNHGDGFLALPEALDREAVGTACQQASSSEQGAEWAFLVSMAWGYGRVGYGRHRTAEALANTPDAVAHLHRAARILANEGAVEAYRHLANAGRIKGLGPAFGTKFLYFCPQADDTHRALILDRIVAAWLRANADQKINPVPWSTKSYERYLDLVWGWSDALDVTAEAVEEQIFVSAATGQWGTD